MARQATVPVQYDRTKRRDEAVSMTSGRAGVVLPVDYIPLLRGDSSSGQVAVDVSLAEMPKPLLNGVQVNVQAWFVPKTADPRFRSYDDFQAMWNGTSVTALGRADEAGPAFSFGAGSSGAKVENAPIMHSLGVHEQGQWNAEIVNSYVLIHNFRLASHSSKLDRRKYWTEDAVEAKSLARAFWPSGPFSQVVPDYERALVVGSLDLDVTAGQIPVSISEIGSGHIVSLFDGDEVQRKLFASATQNLQTANEEVTASEMFAEMAGQSVSVSLADIDKARETQAFAKLRTAYAGNDTSGFADDDAIVADLMSGFRVPERDLYRPWLLDSRRTLVGLTERPATDGANLDKSVTIGRAGVSLSLNVPLQDVGGVILVIVEVLPERLFERQGDDWVRAMNPSDFPDALRDVQRVEPVDLVQNRRVDARHSVPDGLFGFEPMNAKWNRRFTRLGGEFYQDDPLAPNTSARSAIWQAEVVDPTFSEDHFLAPDPFPHDVFSDTLADAFEVVTRHSVVISGLTQIGDVLREDNAEFTETDTEGSV